MDIEHTDLLKALKHDPQTDIPDAEKVEAANELHEWLARKDETK